jgi:hypothetical protein
MNDTGAIGPVLLRRHPKARCPLCGEALWYGLKGEAIGWKVQYDCAGPDGCGREFTPGRIDRSSVSGPDEAHRRAELLGTALY